MTVDSTCLSIVMNSLNYETLMTKNLSKTKILKALNDR